MELVRTWESLHHLARLQIVKANGARDFLATLYLRFGRARFGGVVHGVFFLIFFKLEGGDRVDYVFDLLGGLQWLAIFVELWLLFRVFVPVLRSFTKVLPHVPRHPTLGVALTIAVVILLLILPVLKAIEIHL